MGREGDKCHTIFKDSRRIVFAWASIGPSLVNSARVSPILYLTNVEIHGYEFNCKLSYPKADKKHIFLYSSNYTHFGK